MSKNEQNPLAHAAILAAAILLFIAALYVLRLPTAPLGLSYYDDGESLYHAQSILQGRIPYLEDYTHHFLGYSLPYLALALFEPLSLDTPRSLFFLHQILCALGVFIFVARLLGPYFGILSGLMLLCAREPWEHGFFIQYEINLLTIWLLVVAQNYLSNQKLRHLLCAAVLSGLLFCYDQRGLFFAIIPLSTYLIAGPKRKWSDALILSCAYFALPVLALAYLYSKNALYEFWQQTIAYPLYFRSASKNWEQIFTTALELHAPLWVQSPLLLASAVFGLLAVILALRQSMRDRPDAQKQIFLQQNIYLVLIGCLAVLPIPLLGSRHYNYYTVVWLPLLAILSSFGALFFRRVKMQHCYAALLLFPIVIILSLAWNVRNEWRDYKGDGTSATIEFLKKELRAEDSIFVWGYRLDLYVALSKLSPFAFTNVIYIHPDKEISDLLDREKHIWPEYEKRFLTALSSTPPEYVVVFNRQGDENGSRSLAALLTLVSSRYKKVFETTEKDFTGHDCRYEVFRRNAVKVIS